MHYGVLVILEQDEGSIEDRVAGQLEPGCNYWWDWYAIGGRWTGCLSGYEPDKDPANQETCSQCSGTGTRPRGLEEFGAEWVKEMNGCNGCKGTGKRTKWPTGWAKHPGDVVPLSALTQEQYDKNFAHVVIDGYGHFEKQRYEPWREARSMWVDQELPPLDWIKSRLPDGIAVVVDAHN